MLEALKKFIGVCYLHQKSVHQKLLERRCLHSLNIFNFLVTTESSDPDFIFFLVWIARNWDIPNIDFDIHFWWFIFKDMSSNHIFLHNCYTLVIVSNIVIKILTFHRSVPYWFYYMISKSVMIISIGLVDSDLKWMFAVWIWYDRKLPEVNLIPHNSFWLWCIMGSIDHRRSLMRSHWQ